MTGRQAAIPVRHPPRTRTGASRPERVGNGKGTGHPGGVVAQMRPRRPGVAIRVGTLATPSYRFGADGILAASAEQRGALAASGHAGAGNASGVFRCRSACTGSGRSVGRGCSRRRNDGTHRIRDRFDRWNRHERGDGRTGDLRVLGAAGRPGLGAGCGRGSRERGPGDRAPCGVGHSRSVLRACDRRGDIGAPGPETGRAHGRHQGSAQCRGHTGQAGAGCLRSTPDAGGYGSARDSPWPGYVW